MTRYKQPNFKYDTRIRIYENIDGKNSYQNDMLVNSKTSEWCIPRTENPDTYEGSLQIIMNNADYKSGTISLLLSEPDLINCCGLFGGTQAAADMKDQKYLKLNGLGNEKITRGDNAIVRYAPLSGLNAYGDYNVLEKASDGSLNAPSTKNKLRFSSDLSDGGADGGTKEYTANFDSLYGFYLATVTDSAQDMSVSAEYEHFLMRAGANAKRIQFTPDAEIECLSSSGAYELSMVVDREIRAIDWHKLTVSGRDGGNLKMQLEPGGSGVILSGDSLKNVKVHANTYDADAERTFSTNYDSVRIYEIDEKTVGIAADTDGNGTYETVLEPEAEPEYLRGDADGDGAVTNKDAQTVLVAYTDSLGSGVVDLPEAAFNAADVDGDGKVGAGDAQYILIYYTVNTLAGKPTAWEDLISQ